MADTAGEPQDGLSLRRGADDRAAMVHAVGEVDHATAPRLSDELAKIAEEEPERSILLNLTGVTFMTSAGLAVLVDHHRRALRRGRDLHIVVGDSVVARGLERTGLSQFLSVHTAMADAFPATRSP